MSLDAAIIDATKTEQDKLDGKTPPPLPIDDKTPKGDDDDDDGLSPEEIKNARNFFKGLKDPEKAPVLIDFIAKNAGYSKIETKTELKEAKRDINAILREKLGDEFEPLIEKLGPALDEILKEKLEESTKGLRESIDNDKKEKLQNEFLGIFKGISKDHYDNKDIPDDVAKEMNAIIEDFEPKAGMSMDKYLKSIHNLALINLGKSTRPNTGRTEANRKDAPSRLASERGGQPAQGETVPKKMGLDAAVKAAVEEVENKLNK